MRLCQYLISILCLGPAISPAQSQDVSDRFYQAIRNGDLAGLRKLAKTAGVNYRDDRGATPLMYAAAIGNAAELKLLLDAGADVNARNAFEATALIWAGGDAQKVRMLVGHGADVQVRSKLGRNPLILAAKRNGSASLVLCLLDHGADAGARETDQDTALDMSARAGDLETVRLLIAKSAAIGKSALGNAVKSNQAPVARLLLANGADINAASTFQRQMRNGPLAIGHMTPLMWAAPFGSPQMIQVLLEAGADVNGKDVRGMTPLMLAVASETQDAGVVRLLLRAGADVNAVSIAGETALDWAEKFGDRSVLAALQASGAKRGVPYTPPPAPPRGVGSDSKESLQRSIGLLQRSSSEFFQQSGCVGCHHQTMTALAVRSARAAGARVNEALAREQTGMMISQATAMREFVLEGIDEGLPDIVLNLLEGLAAAGYRADMLTDGIVADLASLQHSDGGWRGGNGLSRAPMQEGDISRTARVAHMLEVFGIPARRAEFEDRISQARAWLLRAKPRTTDDAAMLLLGLSWTGAGSRAIRSAADLLIAQQCEDGGWTGNPNLPSDAFATGEALYAVWESGSLAASDPAYARGVRYLLQRQYPDGSWYVRSRAVKVQPYFQSGFPFDHDQWISAAATAWASMAIAASIEPPGRIGIPSAGASNSR
jgi:ankyrin repeat protein